MRTSSARPIVSLITAVVLLAACGQASRDRHHPGDLLFVRTARGLSTVDAGSGSSRIAGRRAVILADGRILTAGNRDASTVVSSLDPRTGDRHKIARLDGTFTTLVAEHDGGQVALAEARRHTTRIEVVSTDGRPARSFRAGGRLVPEAFSLDGLRLFMIQHLVTANRYRLRELDLRTGTVTRLGARLKQPAPEEMEATTRAQVASRDGRSLYTLYTRQPQTFPHGRPRGPVPTGPAAFVHVLDLVEGTAHCVILPASFGAGSVGSDAIALSPDGRRLVVVDGASGIVLAIDTTTLATEHTRKLEPGPGPVFAQVAPNGAIYLATGSAVVSLDASTLAIAERWSLAGEARGIALAPGGGLYVGVGTQIAILGRARGETTQSFPAPRGFFGLLGAIAR